MNLKLLIGIVLFVIGLIAAIGGIAGVGQPENRDMPSIMVEGNQSTHLSDASAWSALPWIAGLSLALGGALIGLSMGNFKNPRTTTEPGDKVVNPEGYQKMKHV
jgi:hypothetical protein